METAVIFGASGQDGIFMADLCRKKGIEVIAISRKANTNYSGSVADRDLVTTVIRQHTPAYIFHFAANSTTRHDALFENHETISTGTLNILEAVKTHSPKCKVLITGSGLQFVNTGNPITENDPFEATNAYAISRIQSVYAARYFRSLGIKAYVAYLFHHESPYRHDNHLSKMITNKIEAILMGSSEKIIIGDINVRKEWAYAQDIVEGIFTLVNQEDKWEAVIGTGIAYSIGDFISTCMEVSGLKMDDHVIRQSGFKAEYLSLVSNPETIRSLGWNAKTDFSGLVRIMLGKVK